MNHRQFQKIQSREKILQSAAFLFRKNGYSATGIDEIMRKSQLTAGAFYSHFKSKEDLLNHTLEWMFAKSRQALMAGLETSNKNKVTRIAMLRYLSEEHRDHPEDGCAFPSLAAELSRHTTKGKEIAGNHLNNWVDLLTNQSSDEIARENALFEIATAVGSILLSRIVAPKELSDQILRAGRGKKLWS